MRVCMRSSEPTMPASRLLKSCAMPPVSWPDRLHLLRLAQRLLRALQLDGCFLLRRDIAADRDEIHPIRFRGDRPLDRFPLAACGQNPVLETGWLSSLPIRASPATVAPTSSGCMKSA